MTFSVVCVIPTSSRFEKSLILSLSHKSGKRVL
jgi:hypothetical protein